MMTTTIDALPRGDNPLDVSGVVRDENGVARYEHLPRSLVATIEAWAKRTPDAVAVAEIGGGSATYGEFRHRCARVAGALHDRGIRSGDRVAIRLPAGLDWAVAFFGILMAGATAVPVNTRFSEPEIDYVVDDSGSAFVFMPGEELAEAAEYVATEIAPDDRAAIFYTSGTTGFPKGAITTHAAFLTNCENMCRGMLLPLPENEPVVTLISVPLFHVTGCNSQLLTVLYLGGTSVVLPALDLRDFLAAIPERRINFLVTVPAVYALAMNHADFATTDVSRVRRVGYGGAPIAPSLVHRMKKAFPNARLSNGFGMTEAASLLTALPDEYAADHADSVGFACPVVDFALEDVDPQTGVGELLVRGANITQGYWNKPEANDLARIGAWLRTGDLGRVAPNGLIYVVDRAKDMICRGGENVYCVEVENALAGAPGVAESAVIGVPDDVMGEKVGLVMVPLPGATIDVVAVIGSLRGAIADFKIPQYVAIRTTPLPRNPGGKVVKKLLRSETVWGNPLR